MALDAELFGTDRSPLLRRMFAFGEQVRVAEGGFGHCWRNDDNVVVGPVVARDEETARALIGDLALHAGGEVRMDLDLAKGDLVRWADEHGIGSPWEVSLMVRGGECPATGRDSTSRSCRPWVDRPNRATVGSAAGKFVRLKGSHDLHAHRRERRRSGSARRLDGRSGAARG